jgi:hypothetical protein
MAYELINGYQQLWIAEDGSYGGGAVMLTTFDDFSEEQMDILSTLPDNDKFDYAYAVLNGKDTSQWED